MIKFDTVEQVKTNRAKQEEFDFDTYVDERKIYRYRELVTKPSSSFNEDYLKLLNFVGSINTNIKEGSVVSGTIISLSKKEIVVDFGFKDTVTVDYKASDYDMISHLKLNDTINVVITEIKNKPYQIKGSITELMKYSANEKIPSLFEAGSAIDAYVVNRIPAGFNVQLLIDNVSIDAFMPNTLADVNKLHNPDALIGKTVKVMFETLEKEKGVFVVNRRKYLNTLRRDKIDYVKDQPIDKVYEGIVTGTASYGVFVQFEECLTGMISKHNVVSAYRDKIHEIKPGTVIEFYVKEFIDNDNKIILTQTLKESLWDTISTDNTYSGKVIAVISDKKPFGALIELDFETTGLIQNHCISRCNKNIKEGDIVDVRVMMVMRDVRKIYLTFADDQQFEVEKQENIKKLKEKYNA